MSAFSINETALAEILRIFRRSKCREPVARLYERADPGPLPDDFKAALRGGTKSQEELSTMAKKHFEEVRDQLKFSLMVADSERADYPPEDLIEINGITFAMAAPVREALREYCLTFEDGNFILRSADDMARNLRSVKTLRFNPP
jgi:hypothetical protein